MADEVKALLVQVSATTELLRSNLISAERELAQFERTTGASLDRVDRAFGGLGAEAAALRAKLDPMYAAQQRFNREMDVADRLLKNGAISTREYAAAQTMAREQLQRHSAALFATEKGQRAVTVAAGAQRAGMQQLSYQLNDVATMYALGARPMQIFASQSGHVIQSVQMMTGGTSKLARFLGGPWGIALTSATLILAPFVAKLFESADASKAAEDASKALADRQLDISNFFDKSTGKIIENSRALIDNARAQALAGAAQLNVQKTERRGQIGKLISSSRERQVIGFEETIQPATGDVIRTPVYSAPNSDLIDVLRKNRGNPDAIFREVAKLAGSKSSAADEARKLSDLFAQETLGARDIDRLNKIVESFDRGSLLPSLRDAPRAGRGGGRTGGARSRGGSSSRGAQPEKGSFAELLAGGVDGVVNNAIETLNTGAIKFGDTMAKLRNEDFEEAGKIAERKADYEYEVRQQALDRLQDTQARQLHYLANLYEDAFRGGSKAIWDDFKQLGLRVISQVLAEFTLGQMGLLRDAKGNKTGFDLGGSLTSALLGSVFGGFRAGGGPVSAGKAYIVGEKRPELFIPSASGMIAPEIGGGGGTTIQLVINAPGATAETVAMIRRELANAAPAIVEAAKAGTARSMNRRRLG